jgi:hypothetical protein
MHCGKLRANSRHHPCRVRPFTGFRKTLDEGHGFSHSSVGGIGTGAHVRPSVHPDFLSSSLALTNFMRLSLMKAAHASVGGAPCRKSGNAGRKRWAKPFDRFCAKSPYGHPCLIIRARFCTLEVAAYPANHAGYYRAGVAELADAHGSGPCTRKGVGVRVPSSAPMTSKQY